MSVKKQGRWRSIAVAICAVLFVNVIAAMLSTSMAHTQGPYLPENKPPPPPPPPPPCQNWTVESYVDYKVDKNGCRKKVIKYRRVCADTGTGNSVSYRTGYESFRRRDLQVNGAYPIRITRQYMSNSSYDSPVGYGWSFNHDVRLFEYPDNSVVVRTGCGVNYRFVESAGAYQAEVGTDKLAKHPDGTFDLTYDNGVRDHFDTQGRLIKSYGGKGGYLEYEYSTDKMPLIGSSPNGVDPAKPITVAYVYQLKKIRAMLPNGSPSGDFVDLYYHAATGRLNYIESNDGRRVTYIHDATEGKTKGNLVQVNGLEGVVSTYKYEDINPITLQYKDHHNITEIKHTADSTPIQLTYDYQPYDRVITETIGNKVIWFGWSYYPVKTSTTETVTDDQGVLINNVTREYSFDGNAYISEYVDGFGNKVVYTNDANGNVVTEEFYENQNNILVLVRKVNRSFTTDGLKLTTDITLDSGETIHYKWSYDGQYIKTKETWSSLEPAKIFKSETLYNYDAAGIPETIRAERRYKDDGTYLETSYTYNSNGDILTTTFPDGRVMENEYGPAYGGKYVTRSFYYDDTGAPLPDLEETYQYDNKGNRTHVTDARGHTTVTTYDDNNRRRAVTNHLGHLTTFVYDANDNLTQIKRDRSIAGDQLDITKLTYDGENRLTKIERTDSGGAFVTRSTMRYDSAGNVIGRGDAYGNETTLSYDLENRLTRITDAAGNYIQYTLNALGQKTKTEYFKAGGVLVRTSSAVFDDLNRQEQAIGALNQTTTFTYNAVGNRITATDALNRPTTVYSYDTLSRLSNIRDANGKDTLYQYDDRDRLRFVTDPRGLTTEYRYNELGQLTNLISPDTGTTVYTYDKAGNRETQKDARNVTVTYSYDALNRITAKTYPTASLNVTYTYDERANGLGKLTGMSDAEGSTEYDYDERGNLTETRRTASGQPYTTQYGYDNNDRLTSITYPSGRVVSYQRNALGQVTSVTTTPSGGTEETVASNISYIPFGALEDMTFGNALMLDQNYDTDYRLTDQVLGTLYSRTYGYDDVNNITGITDNIAVAKSQGFNYDNLDRLDDATSTGIYGMLDYGYDDVGNRISLTLDGGAPTVYNYKPAANQLDNTTGTELLNFSYDANGNTQTKNAFTFAYDDAKRMVQATDGATTTSYGFNGKGERVRKSGAAITLYHYDNAGNLLFESDTAGNIQVEHIWLGSQRLAMVSGGALYYTHVDHLGTPQLITDGAGGVAWQAEYDPFGEATVTTSLVTNNLRFPGQYYDVETGLHYNYFRDYDPGTGRYLESDPVGLGGGINTYIYVRSNPLKWIDRFGLVAGAKRTLVCTWRLLKDIGRCIKISESQCSPPEALEACRRRSWNNYRACMRGWPTPPHPDPWPPLPPDNTPPPDGGLWPVDDPEPEPPDFAA